MFFGWSKNGFVFHRNFIEWRNRVIPNPLNESAQKLDTVDEFTSLRCKFEQHFRPFSGPPINVLSERASSGRLLVYRKQHFHLGGSKKSRTFWNRLW